MAPCALATADGSLVVNHGTYCRFDWEIQQQNCMLRTPEQSSPTRVKGGKGETQPSGVAITFAKTFELFF